MLVRTLLPASVLLTVVVACSGSNGAPVASAPDAIVEPGAEAGVPDNDDPNAPHALGAILLGESHESGRCTAHAILSLSFLPDAAAQKACTRAVAGCDLPVACSPASVPAKPSSFDG